MQSRMFPRLWKSLLVLGLAMAAIACAAAQDRYLKNFEQRTTVKVLPNGLTLIICERPDAPVFSYTTFIDAGDVNDPSGQSGLAHMFEHLAFKGTSQIGTTDYAAEKVALEKVETANNAYEAEYLKEVGRDPKRLAELKQTFIDAQDEAHKFVIPNQFTDIAERNGAEGLNAETGLDETQFFWSMPENRLELWAWLESSRLADTVPREFYKERDVVIEERRMRTDSNPEGRLFEQFVATAYVAHPYGRSGIGWPSEVSQINATEAMDVPQEILRGSQYRGRCGRRRKSIRGVADAGKIFQPRSRRTQAGGNDHRRAQTVCGEDSCHSRGHAAHLRRGLPPPGLSRPRRRRLPGDQRHSLQRPRLAALSQPGARPADCRRSRRVQPLSRRQISRALCFLAVPLPGHTPAEMRDAIHKEIEKLKTADVTDEEWQCTRPVPAPTCCAASPTTRAWPTSLAEYQTRYGDWRQLFLQLDRVDKVTKADIRRVANEVFVASNRTESMDRDRPLPCTATAAKDGGAQ